MKGIAGFALAATLVAGVSGADHHHRHLHKKHAGTPLDKRAAEVKYVEGPTVTLYQLDGKTVDAAKAKAGIANGEFSIVGETTPTFSPPPAPVPTTKSAEVAAKFFEQKSSSSSSSSSTPKASSTPSTPSTGGSKGIDAEFPSGEIDCSTFPSDYGAVSLPHVGIGGWTTIMNPEGGFTVGVKIATLHQTKLCTAGTFCSYACPAGYQKTQWPETSQGLTGQSIGGLWCNSNGKLELTRADKFKTLCVKGVGGVFVQNKLSGKSYICQTDYPGNEAMTIPTLTEPGGKYELANPDAKISYFTANGSPTTAQYYIDNMDVDLEDACVWDSKNFPKSAGNWAPVNLGVGRDIYGITYLSIFANQPTTTALLDFDIEITGDITAPCALKGGVYTGGGNGCTTAISKEGGVATYVLTGR